MTHNELLTAIAAVLTTALEFQPCPESMCYMALGSDMDKWQTVKSVITAGSLATFVGHSIKLTEKGKVLAVQCNEALVQK